MIGYLVAFLTSVVIIGSFVGGTYYGWWLANHQPKEVKEEEPKEEYNMDMARQWANIMSYDGTERGQIGYAEEDEYDT